MLSEFSVVIFKNKIKKKVIKKFKNFDRADIFFNSLVERNNSIKFEKSIENGNPVDYQISIVGPYKNNKEFFIKDRYGKNLKIYSENKDFSIYRISDYKIEEKIYHFEKNIKISFKNFIEHYVDVTGLKCVSKLNNKIIHQVDDEINIFSCKSIGDCERFFDLINDYVIQNIKTDCLILSDFNTERKKYLYTMLEEKGYSKDFLYRQSTTYLK